MPRWTSPVAPLVVTGALLLGAAVEARAQAPLPDSTAERILTEFARSCQTHAERLWARSVCGPLALVDRASRRAYLSVRPRDTGFAPAGGIFVGRWPDSLGIANTALDWHGQGWSVVMLPVPDDDYLRLTLLAHESFHRVQAALGLAAPDRLGAHLEERDGRLWLRLELRALSYALTTAGPDRQRHARNAMLFRRYRYALFPGADTLERALEIAEGHAEYTGQHTALAATGLGGLRVVRTMDAHVGDPSYARSFAYATGPALGVLLDSFDPAWRTKIVTRRDLAGLLMDAVQAGGPLPAPATLVQLARPYGYEGVLRFEDQRAGERRTKIAEYRRRFLDGPVLELRQTAVNRDYYDPLNLFPLDSLGTVFPNGGLSAEWGKLAIDSLGALVSSDGSRVRVAAPASADGRHIRGPGWVLDLNEGWVISAGERPGDFVVKRQTP
jgi:hypothetical protein